jgi:diketogulonate reductase-like aldo/keto reductase
MPHSCRLLPLLIIMTFTKPAPAFDLSSKTVPSFKLNSGHEMPVVAYGTFRSEPGEVGPAVIEAIKAGYRHLDLAHVYGNEKEIGEALKKVFEEGLVKREDLFITGKLWNSDHDVEIVPQACDHSLGNCGLDYFDLYLIHFPICWKHTGLATPGWGKSQLGNTPLIETWRAMEKLVDAGKCRSIGVSNYPLMLMHDLTTQARIQPACNQIEVHAYYSRESLVNYCLSRNICVTAHTPLGGGALNKEAWNTPYLMDDPVIQKVAGNHKKSPAQVLLRWLLQRGIVVLPKSMKPARMAQNIDLFDFSLSEEEMTEIHGLDKYQSYKTNPNPLAGFLGGPDAFSAEGTDIFD